MGLICRFFIVFLLCHTVEANYPSSWWKYVPPDGVPSWEVLPQDAGAGEVVLSKRTELGIFSNLSYCPFIFEGEKYFSIESLWQMMKYPSHIFNDPRHLLGYPYKRDQVRKLYGFKAKKAGDLANDIMRKNDINWVSYNGEIFDYKDFSQGSDIHYDIIYRAIREKVLQNRKVLNLLKKTMGLKLIPDHHQGTRPESYYYHKILMQIRDKDLAGS